MSEEVRTFEFKTKYRCVKDCLKGFLEENYYVFTLSGDRPTWKFSIITIDDVDASVLNGFIKGML